MVSPSFWGSVGKCNPSATRSISLQALTDASEWRTVSCIGQASVQRNVASGVRLASWPTLKGKTITEAAPKNAIIAMAFNALFICNGKTMVLHEMIHTQGAFRQ